MSKSKDSKKPGNLNEQAVSPQATPTPATSKAMIMAKIVNGIAGMDPADVDAFYDQMMAQIGTEAQSIPDGYAQQNLKSVNSGNVVVSESLKEILETETLSEETKEKASVLFEAAVNTKVALLKAQIEEETEIKLNEEIDKINEAVIDQVDKYLSYVAEQWMKENKTTVRQSVRTSLAESFIKGLHTLCSEHYFSIPEEQVDAVEALSEEVQKLQSQLNIQINENIEAKKALEKLHKEDVIRQETEGLALSQQETVKKLAEEVSAKDMDEFRKKVKILKESTVSKGKSSTSNLLTETLPVEMQNNLKDQTPENGMDRLAQYISKAVTR